MTLRDDGRAFSYWLGLELDEVTEVGAAEPASVGRVDPGAHLRHESGPMRAGAILGLLDCVGGLNGGLAALPRWVVSTNINQRVATLAVRGALALSARTLRVGRNAVITGVEVHDDATGEVVASGVLTSSILTFEGGAPVGNRPFKLRMPDARPPAFPALLGLRPKSPTSVELELLPQLRNPWGILHGAAIGLVVDVASQHCVQEQTGNAAAMTDAAVHFLAPGRVGPIEATGTVVGRRPDGHLVRVELRDRGANDRLLTVAAVTVSPID